MSAIPEQPKPSINVKLMLPFVNAVQTVYATMLKTTANIQRPSLKMLPAPTYDVSAIVGFSGQIVGSVVVSFPKVTALRSVQAFAGIPIAENTSDFADAVGELANMIAGAAKKSLGKNASITCPSVILGAGHVIARLRDVPCVVIPCESELGAFAVEVSIREVEL